MTKSPRNERTAAVPAGMPMLAAGAHLGADDGSCLMEYTAVLAGERFSDHPRCTDPLLAALARLVNDATSDRGRQRLARLAPDLATAFRTDAVGSAALVLGVLLQASEATGRPRTLGRSVARARRHLRRVLRNGAVGRTTRWLEPGHRRGAGRRRLAAAVAATAPLPPDERDAVLHDLLTGALAAVARHRCAASSGTGSPVGLTASAAPWRKPQDAFTSRSSRHPEPSTWAP